MKYVLSLMLVTSAALAAARGTPRDLGIGQVATPAAVVRGTEPPWVTGAWQAAVLEGRIDEDLAGAADDPHAGLHAGSGQCPRDRSDPAWDEPTPELAPMSSGHAHPGVVHAHAAAASPSRPPAVARSTAENGMSVAEIFARRESLGERRVRVRGTIVKLTEGILGKTYLHLEDGSGSTQAGDFDLTVASEDAFELGETVEVEGRVLADHDLGIGYRYAALLDEARRIAPN